MLKRLWFVIVWGWAMVFLLNCATKIDGIRPLDVVLAFAPIAIMWVLRFIVVGPAPRVSPYHGQSAPHWRRHSRAEVQPERRLH